MKKYTVNVSDATKNVNTYDVDVTSEYQEKFSDNIWFTRKARIQAEKRLLTNHHQSQILLVYYSLLVVIASVITLKFNHLLGANTDIIITIFSIIILVLSLMITGYSFQERSLNFKLNYIKLQELYEMAKEIEKNNGDLSEVRKKYFETLELLENHSNMDDIYARVENANTLYSRKPTKFEYIKCYGYRAYRLSIFSILYILPLLIFCIKEYIF